MCEIKTFRSFREQSCDKCSYYEECFEFWHYCPYDGKLAVEKRGDVEIVEDVEFVGFTKLDEVKK